MLLALSEHFTWRGYLSKSYDRYKSDGGSAVISTYAGLILVPAGPNTVRRIGFFEKLPKDEVKESVDEEITIL